jgi:hypothetical protein
MQARAQPTRPAGERRVALLHFDRLPFRQALPPLIRRQLADLKNLYPVLTLTAI